MQDGYRILGNGNLGKMAKNINIICTAVIMDFY